MTVLLVDSDVQALNREAAHLAQRRRFVAIALYSNPEEAVKFARNHDVDVVFTREELTGITGKELVGRILRLHPTAKCHILQKGESVPFPGFTGRELESIEQETAPLAEKENSMVGILLNKMDTGPLGRHYSGDKLEKEGDVPMKEQELRSLGRRQLLELMIEQGKEMETNKASYERDLEFLKTEHERDLEFLKSENEKEVAQLKKELEQAKAAVKEQADSVNEAGSKELETQKSRYEQAMESLKARHQQDLNALKEEHDEETARLREELDRANKALESRQIQLNEAGSIAMAALKVNGVFEAAQAASQQYIESIRSLSERQAAICSQRDMENRIEIERKLKEAEQKCSAMEYECRKKCEAMEQEAKQKSQAYWTEVSTRLQSFYDNHQELKRLLDFGSPAPVSNGRP